MKHLTFWFDVVSPFSYLAFERLPQAFEGLSFEVRYQPVLFAGLLKHFGQKGPAEIGPKRTWTYRHVAWLAQQHGIEFQMPAQHPFNPLPLLRLAWACSAAGGSPNRRVCEAVLHHVWRGGMAADDATRLAELTSRLAPARQADDAAVKQDLRRATDAAVARGVFGVPMIHCAGHADDELFWGYDALDMLTKRLRGEPWFETPAWKHAALVRHP